MTTKSDYSEQEWELLLQAPIMAGTYIMVSDISVTAMAKEMKGMFKAMISTSAPPEAEALVASLVTDLQARSQDKEKLEQAEIEEGADPLGQMLDQIGQALAVLDEKAPQEKNGFCTWLMGVAQGTAEAGKEGGFLGIGAVRVSDKEKAALDKLSRYLGLN